MAVAACLLYAAFSNGATQLPEESVLQVALAAVATGAAAAWVSGALRLRASAAGWTGLALLTAFAAWTALSIAWSVTPDRAWLELNRGVAYVLVTALGVAVGSSLPGAPARAARMLALVTVPVALYALGGKTLPGLHVDGLFDLNHAGGFNRLKAPLEYWNALALFCVIGLLPALRLAADPRRSPRRRLVALLGVYLLALVIGLTYSRGGLVALIVGVAALVALSTERIRTLTLASAALAATLLPLGIALSRPDLTTDLVPLARREDDALLVLAGVLVSSALLVAAGRTLLAVEDRMPAQRARRLGRRAAIASAAVLSVLALAALASGRIAVLVESFKATDRPAEQTDPNRLLSANAGNRWTWWEEAAGAWADRPVAGWGAGSFPVTHRLYRTELLSVQQPHSVPLQWLAQTGLVGLLLAGGAILALLAAAVARVRALPAAERGAAAALAATGVAWAVHAFYDWDWDIPAVTAPVLFALGVLAARPAGAPSTGAGRAAALVVAVVAFVLVAVSAALPALSQSASASALREIGGEQPPQGRLADAEARAELAARLNPLAVEPLFAAASVAERRGRLEQARRYLLRAVQRQPDRAEAWIRLVRFDFEQGNRGALRRSALKALELDPLSPVTIDLARRAISGFVAPAESATATGTPLTAPAPEPADGAPQPPTDGVPQPPTAIPPVVATPAPGG